MRMGVVTRKGRRKGRNDYYVFFVCLIESYLVENEMGWLQG